MKDRNLSEVEPMLNPCESFTWFLQAWKHLTGVECPKNAIVPKNRVCKFDNEPVTPYFWDSSCKLGDLGCLADRDLDEAMVSHDF